MVKSNSIAIVVINFAAGVSVVGFEAYTMVYQLICKFSFISLLFKEQRKSGSTSKPYIRVTKIQFLLTKSVHCQANRG